MRFLLRLYIEQMLTAGFIDRLESDNIGWTPPSSTVKLVPLTPRFPFRRPRLLPKKNAMLTPSVHKVYYTRNSETKGENKKDEIELAAESR